MNGVETLVCAIVRGRADGRRSMARRACALALLLGGAGGVWAQRAAAEIEYGYPDQSIFVPLVNARGQPDSPMTRVVAALFGRAGMAWRAVPYPAARLFRNLREGSTEFSILVRASQLESCCIFSAAPIYATDLNAYFIGDKTPLTQRRDLIGKRVITIRGYSYAGLLQFIADPANAVVNEVADTHKAAFDMLAAGRGDYVIDYASAARDILDERSGARVRHGTLERLQIHLVLSKSYPEAEKTMERLEAIAKTLKVEELLFARRN